jgi:hypothetical protein
MPARLAQGIRITEVVVRAAAEVDELLFDRSGVIHPPTFSMSVARGIR